MKKLLKSRAPSPKYVSTNQLTLSGFESLFEIELNPNNRWVLLSNLLPWDDLCSIYCKYLPEKSTGRSALNLRIVLGAIITKHLCDLDDRETVDKISENIYMQHFLGYTLFCDVPSFDALLFVEFRKRFGLAEINAINKRIAKIKQDSELESKSKSKDKKEVTHKDSLIIDATTCPQDITYPTDIDLLHDAWEKSKELLDVFYAKSTLNKKPRYRQKARKDYLKAVQKKTKTRKNIRSIDEILGALKGISLNKTQYKYLLVIQQFYEQQKTIYDTENKSIEDIIVSIHQPHVRPIVRGKSNSKVEFGANINASLVCCLTFLDDFSWDALNEGTRLKYGVEKYKERPDYYPKEVKADMICCNRESRAYLKGKEIILRVKPLGRPPKEKALLNQVRPGERNSIKGRFGRAKTAYGLDCIKTRYTKTSESWMASIVLVLNIACFAKVAMPYRILINVVYVFKKSFKSFFYLDLYSKFKQNIRVG